MTAAVPRPIRPDRVVVVCAVLIAIAVVGFTTLAILISTGRAPPFDERLIRSLRRADDPSVPIGPRWLGEVGRDITALGGFAVLGLVTAAVAGFLLMTRKYHALVLLLASTLGGLGLSTVLKESFERPRPDIVPHLSYVRTSSFPSGHSMLAAAVYLTLGALLAELVQRRALKVYFLVIAVAITVLVGVSRVYMGVHWPTDVLAGWSGGLAWALTCGVIAHVLRRRGAVETIRTG